MRVLVTGGAGFIGSHVADLLATSGWDVVVLDDLLPQAHGSDELPAYSKPHRFVRGTWAADVRHIVADPTRARDLLGFTARTPFHEGIKSFAAAPLCA